MFTLAVAAMGRKVKSVDAGYINHAYMRYSMYNLYILFISFNWNIHEKLSIKF